jgi:hypothetical protein
MSDSNDRPELWAFRAVASLPSQQAEKLDRPRDFDEIDELVVAHARLLTERKGQYLPGLEAEIAEMLRREGPFTDRS